jgi:peptidoglycan/xylan/chitin deacetylase (PgdA/CDA1 family)
MEHYLTNGDFPPLAISITLDDGFRDNYTDAFPVLKELGIKVTMFIVPACIGTISSKALAAGEEPRVHLTREEIIEMSQYGIEFGSHTMNHRLLHQIPLPEARYEVESAKGYLEELLQIPCRTFAYPAGFYTPQVKRIVESSGHICAFSTTHGPHDRLDLYAINRMEILYRDCFLFQFARKIRRVSSADLACV